MSKSQKLSMLRPAHTLAAELAQWGMDANVLKTAASYMKQYPEASLLDWLQRLVRLGDSFKSSDQTERYRQQLKQACERVNDQYTIQSGDEWAWVLGWAARLMPHYQQNQRLAERISRVPEFQFQQIETFKRPATIRSDPDIPKVRDKVSKDAEDLFSKMQAKWGNKEDDD